jgi:hypothetical protein
VLLGLYKFEFEFEFEFKFEFEFEFEFETDEHVGGMGMGGMPRHARHEWMCLKERRSFRDLPAS